MKKLFSMFIAGVIASSLSFSAEDMQGDDVYVTNALYKVYLYDDAYVEKNEVNARAFNSELTHHEKAITRAGGMIGSLVIESDDSEGLSKIHLGKFGDVWVENFAVEFSSKRRIECPAAVLGQLEDVNVAGTVGFGGGCEAAE